MEISQKVTGSVSFMDRHGNPAPVDGKPVWTNSDEAIVSMVVAEDGLSAEFTALSLGTVSITCDADADLGEGVKSIVATGALSVLPAEAVSAEIKFSEPQDPA